jgi:hypothetical protein
MCSTHFEVQIVKTIDVDVMIGSQKCQTFVFYHGNDKGVHAPSMGSNIPRTRACKLIGV